MSDIKFVRESEKYSRYGNISADGIQKLLGAPNLDRLQTVVRETVQNTWDARDDEYIPEYHIHLRKLDDKQVSILKKEVFTDLPGGGEDDAIKKFLDRNEHWVLEIADYGTSGLGGSIDPSRVPEEESTDFVDFMRNIGTPRDTDKGGGTYGYGKSCLYGFSHCSTILVDSVVKYKNRDTRRLMGCRIGHRFDIKSGKEKGRYTGRHWWGVPQDNIIVPMADARATKIASDLGIMERGKDDYGTTIMILGPDINTDNPEKSISAIAHALLWNFWPKMLVDEETDQLSMYFEIKLNGKKQKILALEDCPPLNIYADAMRKLKKGECKEIWCERPKTRLGKIAFVKAPKEDRPDEFRDGEETSFPDVIHHVALMRPAELVIKYLEGTPLPVGGEWGGVFICDEEDEVERAFAQSEPPAHDDWMPNNLPAGHAKTFVRVALRNIKKEIEKKVGPVNRKPEAGDLHLSKAANFLGDMLSGAKGDAIGKGGSAGSKKRSGKKSTRKSVGVSDLHFSRHEVINKRNCMVFSFRLNGPVGKKVNIHSKAGILLDGGQVLEQSPTGEVPVVVAWYKDNGIVDRNTETLEYQITGEDDLSVAVTVPDNVAISFNAFAEAI